MDTKNNNATNVANEINNEVMNQTIVRLNEMKAVKMSSVSVVKRPAAKFNKEVAKYLLDNWDNLENLKTCAQAMHNDMPAGCEEVIQMYDTRISELEPKQPNDNKEPEEKTIAFSEFEEIMDGVSVETIKEFSDFAGETKQEYMDEMQKWWESATDKEREETIASVKIQFGAAKTDKKSEKKAAKAQTKSEDGEKSKRGRKASHYVGEVHPKNPNWVWMEYAPGKYDWKSIRGKQGAAQFPDRTPVETKGEKKESAGKAEKTTKQAAKKSAKTAKKSEKKDDKKAAKEQEKQLTLEELLAKPIPQGLSKPQQNVIKAFKKGFRIRKDGQTYWLTDKDGKNERTEKAVLEALQRKYKINYIPNGAMLEDK